MQYFLPYWPGDKVYEFFDPYLEKKRGDMKRIWELFEKPPLDGVLVSRLNVDNNKSLADKAKDLGIHSALGYYGKILGDCGAWGYLDETEPPFDPVETLRYYQQLGFDIGVTVDHLIVSSKMKENQVRWKVTVENAKTMFDEFQSTRYEGMQLIGAVQGWDIDSYVRGVCELVDYGFDYIGLGGLARRPTSLVEKILDAVGKTIANYRKGTRVSIHLFGIARESLLPTMRRVGVSSFDSASPLRDAWISQSKNYYLENKRYVALRMREKYDGPNKENFKRATDLLKSLEERQSDAKDVIDKIVRLYPQFDPANPRAKNKPNAVSVETGTLYQTFLDRCWEKCACGICDSLKVHVCIFRMRERNMRRGFHNIYQFYDLFRRKDKRLLVITQCSQDKDHSEKLLPAYRRYLPSPMFKAFWNTVYDLPVDIGIVSAKYGLISWNTWIPDYELRLSEQRMTELQPSIEAILSRYEKVYVTALGLYRRLVENAARNREKDFEIFPKAEMTTRNKLDVIEFLRQLKWLREALMKELDLSSEVENTTQKAISDFLQAE